MQGRPAARSTCAGRGGLGKCAGNSFQVEPWHGDQNTAAGQMHIHHHGHTINVKERQESGGGLTGTETQRPVAV